MSGLGRLRPTEVDVEHPEGGPGYRKMATSASQLFTRRVVVQLLSAASTAILARKLGVAGFGAYAAGLAMYYLALSVCDFGFGSVLARELGSGRPDDGVRVLVDPQSAQYVEGAQASTWARTAASGPASSAVRNRNPPGSTGSSTWVRSRSLYRCQVPVSLSAAASLS